MNKKLFKNVSLIMTPILIFTIMISFSLRDIPKTVSSTEDLQVIASLQGSTPLTKADLKENSLQYNLLGILPIKSVRVSDNKNIEVIPGGNSIGVRLSSEGVLVVGYSDVIVNNQTLPSPAKEAGIEIGDIITEANNEKIESSKSLIDSVRRCKSSKMNLSIIRNGETLKKQINLIEEKNEGYKIGLWVRDSTAGVGTMTFYDKDSGKFAALGHPVTDGDTNEPFVVKEGDLLKSSIISVRKGEKGSPGELKGIFQDEDCPLGKINKNTQCGIFGEGNKASCKIFDHKPIEVGFRDEIVTGKATILTTVDESGPKEYEIEILKLFDQNEPGPKSMVIKVTDEVLLSKTGGIVQGMSGSPIIQNGKIVGAVTHVLINKPDVGYGIYIDWMLKDIGIVK